MTISFPVKKFITYIDGNRVVILATLHEIDSITINFDTLVERLGNNKMALILIDSRDTYREVEGKMDISTLLTKFDKGSIIHRSLVEFRNFVHPKKPNC